MEKIYDSKFFIVTFPSGARVRYKQDESGALELMGEDEHQKEMAKKIDLMKKGFITEEIKEYEITHTDKGLLITNLDMEVKTKPSYKWLVQHDGEGKITKVLRNGAGNDI